MTKNNLVTRAFLNALGVVAYVALFSWGVNSFHQMSGPGPNGLLGMVLFLILFIISACVTGSLVLGKPIMLYHDGMKKEGMHMFAYTLGFLAVLALVIGFVASSSYPIQMGINPTPNPSPNPVPVVQQHCGGNMMNAPSCGTGFHCSPVPGSTLPFGDVGGICVAN